MTTTGRKTDLRAVGAKAGLETLSILALWCTGLAWIAWFIGTQPFENVSTNFRVGFLGGVVITTTALILLVKTYKKQHLAKTEHIEE